MMNSMQLTLELGLGLRNKCPRLIKNSQVEQDKNGSRACAVLQQGQYCGDSYGIS